MTHSVLTFALLHFNSSQYTVHATRLQRGPSGLPICVKRKEGEIVQVIEDLGTPQTKFLFSPGAEQSPEIKYAYCMHKINYLASIFLIRPYYCTAMSTR